MTFKEVIKNIGIGKSLYLRSEKLEDIYGIEEFTEIEHLNLSHNYIKDIEPLKYLINLKELVLVNNHISNIESLIHCQKITILDLDYNDMENLDSILSLDKLKQLSIRHIYTLPKSYKNYWDCNGWLRGNDIIEVKNIIKTERRKRLINLLDQ